MPLSRCKVQRQAAEQAAQRGCAIFILGSVQKLTGSSWSNFRVDPALNSTPEIPSTPSFPMVLVSCCSQRLLNLPHHIKLGENNKIKLFTLKKGSGKKQRLIMSL